MGKGVLLSKYKLKVLGRFELSGPEGPVELANRKLVALLAYLACSAPVPQSRDKLATLFWGSHFEAQARQNLRQALSRLRRILGQGVLIGDGDEVSLAPEAVDCDAARLQALSRDGGRALLAAAAELYQDPLLADVNIAEEAWEDWLGAERLRLEGLALDAMIRHAEQALQSGDAESSLKSARRAIAVNALREDAHRLVVRALAATGRKAEALKHYQDLTVVLKRELNTEPDAVTKSLVADLRSARSAIARERPTPAPFHSGAEGSGSKHAGDEPSFGGELRSAGLEQRQLTIMVCNMVSSAPLSARLDPEDIHDLIAAFQKKVADTVARFDGFVAQYEGNGVLVYFGYPSAHEHDAEQALRASFAVLAAVGPLNVPSSVTFQASIGIATGLVVVGESPEAGDRRRVAIGETPSLAARLQAAAEPGEIVIAASTRRLVGRMFDCRALGANEAEGLSQEAQAWRVLGEAAGVSRFEARQRGSLSPLVGRQEEIDLLLRRWDQARLGEGRVVLLVGEPGIGKSRIAESLLRRLPGGLEGEPPVRIRYSCSPHHTNTPLHPVIAQIEQAAGFEPSSDACAKLDKLEALFKPTSSNVPRTLALIADLLSVPTDGRYPALAPSPQEKREMTLSALLDHLEGTAARRPVLIVFEDVHWIDPTSLDLLDRMSVRAANLPVLLVVTFRPEFQPPWTGQPHVTLLPLSRLGRRDSAAIISGITQGNALPDAVIELILARTDGVPLFIEELTSMLLESGTLRETTGGYALDGPLPELAIPTTLQASLVARLDRLVAVKDVAEIGATIGREFSHQLIAAVSPLAAMDLDAALGRLTASGLVSRRGAPPDAAYSFRHALVQDAAYTTMLRSRRRQLHASVAKALVERFPTLAEIQPEVVGRHFTEAGFANEAIGYWLKAGRLAYARSANREAVSSFEQALDTLEAQPENPSTLEQGFEIRLELRPPLIQLGEVRRAQQRLLEAETLAERLQDDRRCALVGASMTNIHTRLGELDEALQAGTRSLEIAQRLGDLRLSIPATTMLEHVHYYRSEHQRAVDLARGNLAALPGQWISEDFGLDAPPSVFDRGYLIMCLAELGRFGEMARAEAETIGLVAKMEHAYTVAWAHGAAGTGRLLRGDWAEARALFEQVTGGLLGSYAVVSSAWIRAQLGHEGEAMSRLRQGEQLVQRLAADKFIGRLGWLYFQLGRAALALGRLDDAHRLGDHALEFSRRQAGYAAHAQLLLGDVATCPDRFDAGCGEAHYRQALALAEPCGMRPLLAHCHFGLSRLHWRTGAREQAREHIATATTMYRDMDMPFWLEQAEVEMQQVQPRV